MQTSILSKENIVLAAEISSKEAAIELAGGILKRNGYVNEEYVKQMHERERLSSTYMGNYVAIPHGTEDAKKSVKATGITIIQAPTGVDFGNGNIAKLIIGIAGKDNEHLEILSKIAIVCSEETNVEKIVAAQTKEEILALFEEVN